MRPKSCKCSLPKRSYTFMEQLTKLCEGQSSLATQKLVFTKEESYHKKKKYQLPIWQDMPSRWGMTGPGTHFFFFFFKVSCSSRKLKRVTQKFTWDLRNKRRAVVQIHSLLFYSLWRQGMHDVQMLSPHMLIFRDHSQQCLQEDNQDSPNCILKKTE